MNKLRNFNGKMWLMAILKVTNTHTNTHTYTHTHTHTHTHTKKQDLTLSLENKLFEPPHPPMFLRLKLF